MLVPALVLAISLATQPELCTRGAGPLRVLDLPGGVRIQGAGRTNQGDTTWIGWTGAQCTAWISWRGQIRVAEDERTVLPMPGSFLVVHSTAGVEREYRIADSSGRVGETLLDNGRAVSIGPAEREWVAGSIKRA